VKVPSNLLLTYRYIQANTSRNAGKNVLRLSANTGNSLNKH